LVNCEFIGANRSTFWVVLKAKLYFLDHTAIGRGSNNSLDQHPFQVTVVPASGQDQYKAEYVKRLGQAHVACVGNGRNDRLMMREAVFSIAVIQKEGAASETIASSHIVCTDILDALSLFVKTKRIAATLRN